MNPIHLAEALIHDVRYTFRTMSGRPLFTAMALLSLALGIGANTAIYSFMDSILMRSLPVQDPASLVVVNWHSKDHPAVADRFSGSTHQDAKTGYTSGNFPYAAFELLSGERGIFSHIFGFSSAGRLNVQIRGRADLAAGQFVTGEFFAGLGVAPAAGRLIDTNDDRAGAAPVAVVSYGYAQRRFGDPPRPPANPSRSTTCRSLSPGSPRPSSSASIPPSSRVYSCRSTPVFFWKKSSAPTRRSSPTRTTIGSRSWRGSGRGSPGRRRKPPRRRYSSGGSHPPPKTPEERRDLPALFLQEGAGGLDSLRRQYSKPLYVLMTLVGLILAIACANMANLLLARAAGRRREMALRLSLGAGRGRVVRQLLTESVVLALLGGLLGIAFARWGIAALTLLIANGRDQFTLYAELNWHVLALTTALSLATGVLFGLAPALQSTRVDLVTALKQTRAGESGMRFRSRLRVSARPVLIVAQIAISLLLVVAAGLFVRTLQQLNAIRIGFNRENVLLVTLNATQAGYHDDAMLRFYGDLRQRFQRCRARAASVSPTTRCSQFPKYHQRARAGFTRQTCQPTVMNVGPDFAATMEIPLLRGRDMSVRDVAGATPVAVVNDQFAQRYFPNENPLGRHFLIDSSAKVIDFEIVGVTATGRYDLPQTGHSGHGVRAVYTELPPIAGVDGV